MTMMMLWSKHRTYYAAVCGKQSFKFQGESSLFFVLAHAQPNNNALEMVRVVVVIVLLSRAEP